MTAPRFKYVSLTGRPGRTASTRRCSESGRRLRSCALPSSSSPSTLRSVVAAYEGPLEAHRLRVARLARELCAGLLPAPRARGALAHGDHLARSML